MRLTSMVGVTVLFTLVSAISNCSGENTSYLDVWAAETSDSRWPEQFQEIPENDTLDIAFDRVCIHSTKALFLFLRNGGGNNIKFNQIEMDPDSSEEFSVACRVTSSYQACPEEGAAHLVVEPHAWLVLRVTYQPQRLGPVNSGFWIDTDSDKHKRIRVNLTGQGDSLFTICISDCTGDQQDAACASAPEICSDVVVPRRLSVNFGDTEPARPKKRTLGLINKWDQVLEITELNFTGGDFNHFKLDKKGYLLPGMMAEGQRANLELVYHPQTGGEHRTDLRVASAAPDFEELELELFGRSLAPRLCAEPLQLDFGDVASGQASIKPFQITNCGLSELEVMGIALAQDTSEYFSFYDQPSLPRILQVNESLDIHIQYLPVQPGSHAGGVDIFSDDPLSDPESHYSGTVFLSGRSSPRFCDVQLSPSVVMFGEVVHNTSAAAEITLSNQGNSDCSFSDAVITRNSADNEFAILEKPEPGTSFAPGGAIKISVGYTPLNVGPDAGVLSIYGNDSDTTELRLDLSGQGVNEPSCELSVTPTSYQFGMVMLNSTATTSITLTNSGQIPCNIDRLEIIPSNISPGDISMAGAPNVPFQLDVNGAENSTMDIEITFAPRRPGTHKSFLFIGSDDPDLQLGGIDCIYANGGSIPLGTACVPLTGSSDAGYLYTTPSELDFGIVTVGCASSARILKLSNTGGFPVTISRMYFENPNGPFSVSFGPGTPYELQGGTSIEIGLRYVPVSLGTDNDRFLIESNASNTQLIALPVVGLATSDTQQIDTFYQLAQAMTDVLFVVDNSGSMSEEQSFLINNFESFIQRAFASNNLFQIGVIATEVNAPEAGVGSPPRDIFPGVLVQAPSRPKIITNSTPDLINAFRENASLGTCCSDEQEAGLQAAWLALSPTYINDPARNLGFLRYDAKLYLVIISDEQDQSQGSVDFYVDFLRSLKGFLNDDLLQVSVIVGDAPDGCGNGLAESGSRYIEAAEKTGGTFVSICDSNWSANMQLLGEDAFRYSHKREFPLTRLADPDTIVVTVDGQAATEASGSDCENCTSGWIYIPNANSICFCPDSIPPPGAQLEVQYTSLCLSP